MKKTSHKKPPKKFKQTALKSYKKIFTIFAIASSSILLGLVIGIFYGNQIDDLNNDIKSVVTIDVDKKIIKKEDTITFEEKTKALEIGYVENTNNNIYIEKKKEKKENKNTFHFEEPNLEAIDKEEETTIVKENEVPPLIIKEKIKKEIIEKKDTLISVIKKKISNKPKLVIIIDDMTTQKQINTIRSIGYAVNMSFLPPTKGHKSSAKITRNLEHFMIHLPLQASSFRYEEENTLHIDDSLETIEKRIKYLRELYPNTNYLNNHTGSKFTSNTIAMDKLFEMLKKYNYTFVDSRTTAKSVAKQASKKYGVKMFSRNIFLDNKKDKKYIQKQLKKSIKIAKKNGIAIAIGHPYSVTFKTLKESKHLLNDLDLVYIHEL